MEYSYRCSRCGRRTPSFDYEDHLKDYAVDWKISENETLCDKCKNGDNKEYLQKIYKLEIILTLMVVAMFIAFIYCLKLI